MDYYIKDLCGFGDIFVKVYVDWGGRCVDMLMINLFCVICKFVKYLFWIVCFVYYVNILNC